MLIEILGFNQEWMLTFVVLLLLVNLLLLWVSMLVSQSPRSDYVIINAARWVTLLIVPLLAVTFVVTWILGGIE